MEEKDFISHLAEQYDDVEVSSFTMDTDFRSFEEWSSLTALSIMVMIGEKYGIKLSGEELKQSKTVRDLYDLVKTKLDKHV